MRLNQKLWLGINAPLFLSINLVVSLTALAIPAGDQSYRVIRGDTLSQIAETHYGNWVKWHELWGWNKEIIPNPNLIYPGQQLRLENSPHLISQNDLQLADNSDVSGGSGGADSANDGAKPRRKFNKLSEEWRLLPIQPWEIYVFPTDPEIDPMGFDRRSRVATKAADKTDLIGTIYSDRVAIHGEIVNSRNEYTDISLGDQVFIKADEQLQVGTTYSVTDGPEKVTSPRDGRVGFTYDLEGKVRIVGVRDSLFIATVTDLRQPIERHQLLIPEVQTVLYPNPIAAPTPIEAVVIVPKSNVFSAIGEQQTVFIDRGTDDGIKPGMIFRHYLHSDPLTGEEISTKDFLIEAEMLVIDAKDKFCTAVITNSRNLIHPGDDLTSLSDLSTYDKHSGMEVGLQDKPDAKTNKLDDLDQIDQAGVGLGDKENKELRQLENFSKPVPGATLQQGSEDDIKVDHISHPGDQAPVSIGHEAAPNDGSDKLVAPTEVAPAPETAPAPIESTPPKQDAVLDSTPSAVTPPPQNTAPATPPSTPPENAPPPLMGDPSSSTPPTQIEGTMDKPKDAAPVQETPASP